MYTPIISRTDLTRLLYQEILDEITRLDSTKIDTAISTSISEVRMYLTRFDMLRLFGDQVTNVAADFPDDYLKQLCIDIACWQLIRLANPNINSDTIKEGYTMAIKSLERIQKGLANPQWPLATQAQAATPSFGGGSIINNPLRNTSGYEEQQQLPKN